MNFVGLNDNFVRENEGRWDLFCVFFCWEEEQEAQSVVMYDSKELLEVASSSVEFFFSLFSAV
jgi:hypothetical protein